MNKNQVIAASVIAASVGGVALYAHSLHKDMYSRFPEIDRKIIRKAYRIYLTGAFTQTYDLSDLSYEEMDKIFLQIVNQLQDKN